MRYRISKLVIACALSTAFDGAAYAEAAKDEPASRVSRRSFLCRAAFTTAKVVFFTAVVPDVILAVHAFGTNRTHIGHRIYFSMEHVLRTLSVQERQFVDSLYNSGSQLELAKFYSNKLAGDYEDDTRNKWWFNFFKPTRDASEFMYGQCNSRGVCRHKSAVFAAIMTHYNIDATIEVGHVGPKFEPFALHEWVKIRLQNGSELVVDPTRNEVMNPDDYYKSIEAELVSSLFYKFTKAAAFY